MRICLFLVVLYISLLSPQKFFQSNRKDVVRILYRKKLNKFVNINRTNSTSYYFEDWSSRSSTLDYGTERDHFQQSSKEAIDMYGW